MKNLNAILSSWYFKWTVAAIIIRLILSAITYHPDLLAFSFVGRIFAENGVLDIYSYLTNLPVGSLYLNYGNDFFTYPPLAYFVVGLFHFILQPFFDPNFYSYITFNFNNPYLIDGFFKHATLVKLPYLVFDLVTAFVLANIFTNESLKRKAFLLWIFNPVSLYSSFMVGQFDIIPTFFVVLALWLAVKSKNNLALLSLGVGGAFKIFPLLLIPFAIIILSKNSREMIKLTVLGLLPFVVTTLPFINSEAFRSVVLFSNQSQKLLFAGINVSGADTLYLFVVGYVFLLGQIMINKQNGHFALWHYFLAILLFLFAVTNFHPQWFLWVTPFLIIFICEYGRFAKSVYLLLLFFVAIVFTFDQSLSYGLFAPIAPIVKSWPNNFIENFAFIIEPSLIRSLLRSIFASIALIIIFIIFAKPRIGQHES